jgi:hypothetical protein
MNRSIDPIRLKEAQMVGDNKGGGRPQIRFALSRGLANGGRVVGSIYPGLRSRTRLPWAIFGRPYQGFSLRLRRQVIALLDNLPSSTSEK